MAVLAATGRAREPCLILDSGLRRNDECLGAMNRAPTQKTYPYVGRGGLDSRWRRPLHNPQMKCERGNAPLLANLGGPVFGFPLARE